MVVSASRLLLTSTFEIWHQKPRMSFTGSAQKERDPKGKNQELRREVKLALKHSRASMINAIRDIMAELRRTRADRSPAALRAALLLGRSRTAQYSLL